MLTEVACHSGTHKGILEEDVCLGQVTEAKYKFLGKIRKIGHLILGVLMGSWGWGRGKGVRPVSRWRCNHWPILTEEMGTVLIAK